MVGKGSNLRRVLLYSAAAQGFPLRQVALIRRKTFRHAKNHQSLVVGAGCIHGGKRVKSQTCALLKFLTIRKARSRHTTTKGICIYLRDDEDFVREEKSRKRGAASRDLVNRRPKGRDTRSKSHCARTKVRPCQYGARYACVQLQPYT